MIMATRMRGTAILLSLQTDSGAHPASYPIRTEYSFPRDKVVEVKGTWIYILVYPLPRAPSWYSADLVKSRDKFI
jgi:hypothetical protein